MEKASKKAKTFAANEIRKRLRDEGVDKFEFDLEKEGYLGLSFNSKGADTNRINNRMKKKYDQMDLIGHLNKFDL